VLDAGCGTGRVAIRLAYHGVSVTGVDIDPEMLAEAEAAAPHLDWWLGDLATVGLGRLYDVVLMAGNVMLYVGRGNEGKVLRNMARHLAPGGRLISGFALSMDRTLITLDEYDRIAQSGGLTLQERYSGWECEPWRWDSPYAVSVHGLRVSWADE
jgi:SAM-dependent methyltransferase